MSATPEAQARSAGVGKSLSPSPAVPANGGNADNRGGGSGGGAVGSGRAYGRSSFRGVNLNGHRWLARISQVLFLSFVGGRDWFKIDDSRQVQLRALVYWYLLFVMFVVWA